MNYKSGLFRVWVVIAAVIMAFPTVFSINLLATTYKKDIYLHQLPGPNEISFNLDTCRDEGKWHEVLHDWQVKSTKFRYIVCGTSRFKNDAERQKYIDDTVNGLFVANTANDHRDSQIKGVIEYFQIALGFLGVWVAVLIATTYIARGFAKPKA